MLIAEVLSQPAIKPKRQHKPEAPKKPKPLPKLPVHPDTVQRQRRKPKPKPFNMTKPDNLS
jgi:hypothetical protein